MDLRNAFFFTIAEPDNNDPVDIEHFRKTIDNKEQFWISDINGSVDQGGDNVRDVFAKPRHSMRRKCVVRKQLPRKYTSGRKKGNQQLFMISLISNCDATMHNNREKRSVFCLCFSLVSFNSCLY